MCVKESDLTGAEPSAGIAVNLTPVTEIFSFFLKFFQHHGFIFTLRVQWHGSCKD
jgi:hypothetical protein